MGLDSVELVMELEDAFGVSIPDDDAEKAQTVGQTVLLIVDLLSRSRGPDPSYCASARAFYQLRRELVAHCGIARKVIRPDSRVGELVPSGPRRNAWADIARRCGLPKPRLNPIRPFSPRFPRANTTFR